MDVDDLAFAIRSALDDNGKTKIPVVAPGTPISVLPCVVLAPAADELGDGNRTIRYGFDITVTVPRSAQTSQYGLLVELEAIVVRSLIPSPVRFDGPFLFAATGGDGTGEPPALARIIPVSFAADVDLC